MNFILKTLTLSLVLMAFIPLAELQADPVYVPKGGALLPFEVHQNDTIYLCWLHDLWIYPKKSYSSKKQEQYYWRTVRDVKKTLPFAKVVGSELRRVNMEMLSMKSEFERKKYLNKYEKEVFKKYESHIRKMTIRQGQLLLKLIDRECDKNSYDLIKQYRGGFSAFFWQGVARIFGSNLKSEYDPDSNDRMVERIINLVEAGQI